MRYCNRCHRVTHGEPLYCQFCGSTYDVKLCPHRHVNPRIAQVCTECGSRDLSTPAPQVPIWLRAFLYLLSIFPGLVLLLISVLFVITFIQLILTNQQMQLQLLILTLLIGILWFIYLQLPPFIRKLPKTLWKKRKTHKSKD